MKKLLEEALDTAFVKMKKSPIKTIRKAIYLGEEPIVPMFESTNLKTIVEENGISFDSISILNQNGDSELEDGDEVYACWEIKVDKTDEEILSGIRKRFERFASQFVFTALTNNGYSGDGYDENSYKLKKEFNDTTVYDLYIAKDFTRLEQYYSLRFKKSKSINFKIVISYQWGKADKSDLDISDREYQFILEESASVQIEAQMKDGYKEGQLSKEINLSNMKKPIKYVGKWIAMQKVSDSSMPII